MKVTIERLLLKGYYAPPWRPEGPSRCPDRGNAEGAFVFWSKFILFIKLVHLLQYPELL